MQTEILVTGGSSMVGKHLKVYIPNAVYVNSKDFDLRNERDVQEMFEHYMPKRVIHLAAKVGGIMDNISNPVQFFNENILINTHVLSYAHLYGVKRFTGILSTCIYPDTLPDEYYPLSEECLHKGPPAATNFSYGYAKRCLAVQIDSYNKQYSTKYNYLIPTNLYSEHDHFIGNKAHFVSSLIHKIAEAKLQNKNSITLFGTGTPLRQFMHADDLASIIRLCVEDDITTSFNVCNDENLSIKQIAEVALEACDATNLTIEWDTSKPDGQYRKDASNVKLKQLFPQYRFISLKSGIKSTFKKHYYEMATK